MKNFNLINKFKKYILIIIRAIMDSSDDICDLYLYNEDDIVINLIYGNGKTTFEVIKNKDSGGSVKSILLD